MAAGSRSSTVTQRPSAGQYRPNTLPASVMALTWLIIRLQAARSSPLSRNTVNVSRRRSMTTSDGGTCTPLSRRWVGKIVRPGSSMLDR